MWGSIGADREERIEGGKRGESLSPLAAAVASAESRSQSGEWAEARGPVFVGLYAVCHRVVYRVLPLELDDKSEWKAASRAASAVMHEHFGDDPDAMAAFVAWAWRREEKRASYCKSQGWDRRRMGWRLMFSSRTVTDYRAEAR